MIFKVDSADGIIKIGSPPEELPGIMESIKISDSLLIKAADMQGRSGKVKDVQGWDDADIVITLSLIDDPEITIHDGATRGTGITRWDCLKQIAAIFKKVDSNGKPEIYTLIHPMINAWGTKQFLFSSLETTESRTRRKVLVTLEFMEYDPIAGIIQDRQKTAEKEKTDLYSAPKAPIVPFRLRREVEKLENRYGNV